MSLKYLFKIDGLDMKQLCWSVRLSLKELKLSQYNVLTSRKRVCVCARAAARCSVIHIETDNSRTYIRHTIQIHINVPIASDLLKPWPLWRRIGLHPAAWPVPPFKTQTHAFLMFQLVFVSQLKFPGCLCVEVEAGASTKWIEPEWKQHNKHKLRRKSDARSHLFFCLFPRMKSLHEDSDRNLGLLGFSNLFKRALYILKHMSNNVKINTVCLSKLFYSQRIMQCFSSKR